MQDKDLRLQRSKKRSNVISFWTRHDQRSAVLFVFGLTFEAYLLKFGKSTVIPRKSEVLKSCI